MSSSVDEKETQTHTTTTPRPSVGRIVRYRDVDRELAAIVTDVATDADSLRVNLCVFGPEGGTLTRLRVPYAAFFSQGTWCWPPRTPS